MSCNALYIGTKYPTTGFAADSHLAGDPYNAANGAYSQEFARCANSCILGSIYRSGYNQSFQVAISFILEFNSELAYLLRWFITHSWVARVLNRSTLNPLINVPIMWVLIRHILTLQRMKMVLGFVRDVTVEILYRRANIIFQCCSERKFCAILERRHGYENSFTGKVEYRKQQRNMTLNLASNQLLESNQ